MLNQIHTTMKESKSKLAVISREDICFPVEVIKNPEWTNSEYSRIVVGTIGGREKMLNYCSPVYELVKNADVFPKIEDLFNLHGIQFKATYSHIGHVRFYASFVIENPEFAHRFLGTNDVIKFKWHQQMSYNGKTKLMGWGGFYRQVCTNGLMIPCVELQQFNLRVGGKHTESIKVHLATIDAMLTNLVNNYSEVSEAIIKKYELLGGRMVTDVEDRITEVLEAVGITAVENSKFNTVNDITLRITSELEKPEMVGYNGVVNDWLVYNGINQYINDESRNSTLPEKRSEIDSKVLEYLLENA
jgi:hypothetical protein